MVSKSQQRETKELLQACDCPTSPLVAAEDAVHIDSSTLSIDAVCDRVFELAAGKGIKVRSPN